MGRMEGGGGGGEAAGVGGGERDGWGRGGGEEVGGRLGEIYRVWLGWAGIIIGLHTK